MQIFSCYRWLRHVGWVKVPVPSESLGAAWACSVQREGVVSQRFYCWLENASIVKVQEPSLMKVFLGSKTI